MFLPFSDFNISSMFISRPTRITSRNIPNSEITFISSVRCIKFKRLGPKIIPAIISPIIDGCLNLSKSSPKKRAVTNNISKLVKNGSSNDGKSKFISR